MHVLRNLVANNGFALIPSLLTQDEQQNLLDALGPVGGAGKRGVLGVPPIANLAASDRLLDFLQPFLAARPRPVRAIFFDKSPQQNWLVPWHQDLTIAVNNKNDAPGFGPWSIKDGVHHVQPPAYILDQMLTVRLHLDDCDESNGALQVLPGSHRFGRLSPDEIQKWRNQATAALCCVPAGGALLMRPLLLHSSGRSQSKRHRRVLHIEYASFPLPHGLEWYESA